MFLIKIITLPFEPPRQKKQKKWRSEPIIKNGLYSENLYFKGNFKMKKNEKY